MAIQFPSEQSHDKTLDNIMAGAGHRLCVALRYQDKSGEITERLVEPYEFKNDKLFAHCRDRKGIRAFNTHNILVALTTDVPYEPKFPIKIASPNYVLKSDSSPKA